MSASGLPPPTRRGIEPTDRFLLLPDKFSLGSTSGANTTSSIWSDSGDSVRASLLYWQALGGVGGVIVSVEGEDVGDTAFSSHWPTRPAEAKIDVANIPSAFAASATPAFFAKASFDFRGTFCGGGNFLLRTPGRLATIFSRVLRTAMYTSSATEGVTLPMTWTAPEAWMMQRGAWWPSSSGEPISRIAARPRALIRCATTPAQESGTLSKRSDQPGSFSCVAYSKMTSTSQRELGTPTNPVQSALRSSMGPWPFR